MTTDELRKLVIDRIDTKQEGDWWDFKEKPHSSKVDLVHDIIAMANSKTNRDSYIIFGVVDATFQIVGVEQSFDRRTQQQIIDILRSANFVGSVRPQIELRTIYIQNHELDVLIIKNTKNVPYYLEKNYVDKNTESKRAVRAYHIYTRVCDTNTPIDSNADLNDIEYLWRKRFGIDLSPKEKLSILLNDFSKWNPCFGNKKYAYHEDYPEYQLIQVSEFEKGWEAPAAFYLHPSMFIASLNITYHNTILYETKLWALDEMRIILPAPSLSSSANVQCLYYYYLLDSIEGKLLNILTKRSLNISSRGVALKQFLIFANKKEKEDFDAYMESNFNNYPDNLIMPCYVSSL